MNLFTDVVRRYVKASNRSYRQLAELSGLPTTTISDWVNGHTRQPRVWQDVVALAAALELDEAAATELLEAANYPTIAELLKIEDPEPEVQTLLESWAQKRLQTPFQVPPIEPIHFISREKAQSDVKNALLSDGKKCVIHGMPGVGKTSLAVHIARQLRQHFVDGILWARIPDPDPDNTLTLADRLFPILKSFIEVYGERDVTQYNVSDLNSLSRIMRDLLAQKQTLVVLDDVHDHEELDILLPSTNSCAVLIITRDRALGDERNFTTISIDPFNEKDGLALFGEIVGKGRVAEEKEGATEAISLVEGHPLALRLMANNLNKARRVTIAEYCNLLAEQPEDLFQKLDRRTNKGVWQTFELAYKLLPDDLKELWTALAVFEGDHFSVATVVGIADGLSLPAVRLAMADLIELALVTPYHHTTDVLNTTKNNTVYPDSEDNMERYQLHGLLKLFARAKLGDQFAVISRRAASCFVEFAMRFGATNYRLIALEWENISGTLRWAQQQKAFDILIQGLISLSHVNLGVVGFLDAYGYWHQASTWLESVLANLPTAGDQLQAAGLYFKAGAFALRMADHKLAEQHLLKSLSILEDIPQSENIILHQAYVCEWMAQLLMGRDMQTAAKWSQRGIEVLKGLDEPTAQAQKGYLLIRHAIILGRSGHSEEALDNIEKGVSLLPKYPTAARVSAFMSRGVIHNILGDSQAALKYWEAGERDAEAIGDNRRLAGLWRNIAIQKELTGQMLDYIEYNQKSLRRYERLGDRKGIGHTSSNLGFVHILLGELDMAQEYIATALEIAQTHQLSELTALVKVNLARWHMAQQQWDTAAPLLAEATQIYQGLNLSHPRSEIHRLEAGLALQKGDGAHALGSIEKSLAAATENEHKLELKRSWRVKGEVLGSIGNAEQAVAAYKRSLDILSDNQFEQARSQLALGKHFQEVAKVSQAKPWLESAEAVFKKLKLDYYVQQTKQLLNA